MLCCREFSTNILEKNMNNTKYRLSEDAAATILNNVLQACNMKPASFVEANKRYRKSLRKQNSIRGLFFLCAVMIGAMAGRIIGSFFNNNQN